MDEPFAALDAMTREQLYGDLQRIWQDRKKTIVFVTHNVREACCLGNRVVLFSPRPGRIREIFPVDIPRPRQIFTVRAHPRYIELRNSIWEILKSEQEENPPGEPAHESAR